jgi:hypothetical protein
MVKRIPTDMIEDRVSGQKLSSNLTVIGQHAFYVESYYNLKIAVANGYDYAPCIQKAFDDAAGTSSIVVFPSGQNLLVGSPIRIKGQNGNHIFGNRCVLTRTGLTASSDSPILYYLGLTDIGGTSKSYNYNSALKLQKIPTQSTIR